MLDRTGKHDPKKTKYQLRNDLTNQADDIMNEDFFRQAEVKCKIDQLKQIKSKDSALDAFQAKVINTLLADLEVTTSDKKARPP